MYTRTHSHASENLRSFDIKSVARALGGDVTGRNQAAAPGPGHSRHDRSLSVTLSASAPDGFLVHSHAGDDFRDCRDHVKAALGIVRNMVADRDHIVAPPAVVLQFDTAPDPDKVRLALSVWNGSVNPVGTPVEAYLRSRSLVLDDAVAGNVLRWHPRLRAMVALFRNIETDEPQAVSRTFLDDAARKIDRRFLGQTKGAAIKLDADDEVLEGLHIGEGIETCLAARMMGLRPSWALGSAGAIAAFPVLNGVECLTLLREHDEANAKASDACAARWVADGREVFNILPKTGKDVNDSLRVSA